jgi:hypothetical protein
VGLDSRISSYVVYFCCSCFWKNLSRCERSSKHQRSAVLNAITVKEILDEVGLKIEVKVNRENKAKGENSKRQNRAFI